MIYNQDVKIIEMYRYWQKEKYKYSLKDVKSLVDET